MTPVGLALVAVLILAFTLVSKRLEGSLLTAPMLFVASGLVLSSRAAGRLAFLPGEAALVSSSLSQSLLKVCDTR